MSECGVKEFKLRELLKIYNGTKYDHLNKGDIPLYGSGGLMSHVNEALYSGEAILLPRKGTLSNIMYVNESFWTVDTMYYAVVNDKLADAFYLYSYLSQLDLSNLDSGSTLPSMTKSAYESIVVKLPDLKIQKAVATILFNIRKSWKSTTKSTKSWKPWLRPSMTTGLYSLISQTRMATPTNHQADRWSITQNSNAKSQKGGEWQKQKIAQTGSGGTPKSTNVSYYSNGEIPWINSGELEQTVITSTSNFITEEGLNNSSAKLFPSGTILVAMYGATAGKVSFLTFEASTNQAICAIMLNDIRMRYYLKNVIEDLYQYLVKLSTGSARDNLSQDMIKNIKVVIPSNDILDRYYDFSNNIIKEITKKQQENEQLTQLRDWLLPMLMNGQVKV